VRSALLSVKGVSRARVQLEGHEAVVTYDPAQCHVNDLIAAVGKAEGPMSPNQYTAALKK
jgi:copper chaperone CopZ